MRWTRGKKITIALVTFVLVGLGAAALWMRPEPLDTRFNGAYRLDDGRLVTVTAREGDTLRYRVAATGESRALYPLAGAGGLRFGAGPGWAGREPVEVEVAFELDERDRPGGFTWVHQGVEQRAERLELREQVFTFPSGELALRGKLTLPPGPGPHPVVIPVHGSGAESAVDTYYDPYLFAPHGIATLVYDKRGTGESEGSYLQNFHVLAGDTIAAVEAVRSRHEIDPGRIHLAGYSQGGWIAPLAASRFPGIASLLINYGPMVSVAEEDRWGYVYELRRKGFGEEAIAEADRLNDLVNRAVGGDSSAWAELGPMLDRVEGSDWFRAATGSDSTVGMLGELGLPVWMLRLYAWWRLRPVDGHPVIDRFYDPVPAVSELEIPSLWIFGGEDSSMPTRWSIDELVALRGEGRPIELLVYPEAEHGILIFEDTESGERSRIGYEPTYQMAKVAWLRFQSGLDEVLRLPTPAEG